jgi:hypothetical protein
MGGGFRGGWGGSWRGGWGGGWRGGWGGGWRGGWRGGFRGGWVRFNRFGGRFVGVGYYPWGSWGGWGYPYASYSDFSYPYDGGNAYPVVSSDSDGYGYAPPSPVVILQSQPAPAPQPVIVVQSVPQQAPPQERTWFVERPNEKPIYLFAFKGQSSIRAAEAYWITGSILHYVTLHHEQKQVPLDTVDPDLTMQLNRERGLDIWLSPRSR